jgi:hypothetical protein
MNSNRRMEDDAGRDELLGEGGLGMGEGLFAHDAPRKSPDSELTFRWA